MIEQLRARLAALGIRTPMARDAVLAGVVALVSAAMFATVMRLLASDAGSPIGIDGIHLDVATQVGVYVTLVVQSAALTLRRRLPLVCLALTLVGQLALIMLLPPMITYRGLATLVAAYTVGSLLSRRTALWTTAAAALVEGLLTFILGGGAPLPDGGAVATQIVGIVVSALLTYVGAAFVGIYMGTHRRMLAELRGRVTAVAAEQDARAAQAVLAERGRMARELHDVAAHHLSGIVVQAAAAQRQVESDPDAARESMGWIRTQGRETLDNLRMVVGLLRGDETAEQVPQPGLADVDGLLEEARAAGARISSDSTGTPWPLGPTAELTIYRVLQESLSNARRHAPGRRIDVRRQYTDAQVALTVSNPAPGAQAPDVGPASDDVHPATGHGLIGMRERAAMLHGRLDAGLRPDGTWRVHLVLPRGAERAASDTEEEELG